MGYLTVDEVHDTINVTPREVVEKPVEEIRHKANTEELVPQIAEPQKAAQAMKMEVSKETVAVPKATQEKAADDAHGALAEPGF